MGVPEFAEVITDPNVTIVDVRTPQEFSEGYIDGAVNIPVELPDFMDRVSELDPSGTYAVYCRSGNRSQPAVQGMASVGINGIYEIESGTTGWTYQGHPLVHVVTWLGDLPPPWPDLPFLEHSPQRSPLSVLPASCGNGRRPARSGGTNR